MRIKKHPILDMEVKQELKFTFDGKSVVGLQGDTIASALYALGLKQLSVSINKKRPRGLYCAIGNCSSCHMIVNGIPNIKTCVTLLEEGMNVEMQTNKGEVNDN